jgi:hypothetical protein
VKVLGLKLVTSFMDDPFPVRQPWVPKNESGTKRRNERNKRYLRPGKSCGKGRLSTGQLLIKVTCIV